MLTNRILSIFLTVLALLFTSGARADAFGFLHGLAVATGGIIRGQDAKPGSYPGSVFLYKYDLAEGVRENLAKCSGVVINGCLLSAGHCLDKTLSNMEVMQADGSANPILAKSIRLAPGWQENPHSALGTDLAVAKLEKRMVGEYGVDILTTEAFKPWTHGDVKTEEDYEKVKGKGTPATLVSWGKRLHTQKELDRIGALPPEERQAEVIKLAELEMKDNLTNIKQTGSIEVLGTMAEVRLNADSKRLADAKLVFDALEDTHPKKAEAQGVVAEQSARIQALKAMVAWGVPSSAYGGDSGGAVFARDSKGIERLFGLIGADDKTNQNTTFTALTDHSEWLLAQLKELGCEDAPAVKPPESMGELNKK